MKYFIIIYFMLGLLGCSNNQIDAAGVIAYAQKGDTRYILLADHSGLMSYRGYGAFGGGLEANETLEQGALREFHEETACHFVGHIQSVSKRYVRNQNYVSFVVRVPFIPAVQLNQTSVNAGCQGAVYSERENWVWVKQEALFEQLQKGDTFKSEALDISLWDKSTAVMKLALQQGLLL